MNPWASAHAGGPRRDACSSVKRGDAVDLHFRALPQERDPEARPGRERVVEPFAVDPVHRVEVMLVDELDLRLHHSVQRRAGRLEDRLEVVDWLLELGLETALDEVACLGLASDLRRAL